MSKISYKLFFSVLGNKTRLDILLAMRKGPKNVSQLTRELNCNQTTISHSLQKLTKCGFVRLDKRGKERFYSLNHDTVDRMLDILSKHKRKYCQNISKGE